MSTNDTTRAGLAGAAPERLVEQALASSASVALRGLRLATRATAAMMRTVTDDPRAEAVRDEVVTTIRRLLEVPDSLLGTSDDRASDAAEVRRRFQELLARSSDVQTVQGEVAMLEIVSSLVPDEARMLRHLGMHGPMPAVDLQRVSRTGQVLGVVHVDVSLLAERAGAAHAAAGPRYVANLIRLGLVEPRAVALPTPDEYLLIEGRPEMAASIREIRAERGRRPRVRRGHLTITPLGQHLLSLAELGAS